MGAAASFVANGRKGIAASLFGGLLLTTDVPLLKLAHADAFTLIAVRGVFAFISLLVFWSLRRGLSGRRTPFVNGYTSVAVSVLTAAASILFIHAISLTPVANVVFILAFNPLFAAVLAWIVLGERLELATAAAVLASITGVGIIVFDSLGSGDFIGNTMALAVALILAVSITTIRRSGSDQSMSSASGGLLAAAMVVWFSHPLELSSAGWGWLTLNGLAVIPAASALLMYAPRHVPGPVVAMFYLLETVLTPVWMWLVFGEVPSVSSLVGGIIVIISLAGHSLYMLLKEKESPKSGSISATRPLQIATTLPD